MEIQYYLASSPITQAFEQFKSLISLDLKSEKGKSMPID